MRKSTVSTSLICPECGNVFPIMRKANKEKSLYHRKWLYCIRCSKTTNHIEVKDLDRLIYYLENTPEEEKTAEEKKVYKLIKNRGA